MTRTLKTVTLGCKVNQYETEYVRQGFQRLGYRDAAEGEPVDLCIVNTCTVTAESEAKSRKTIRRLAKAHPEAEIIVMGCYATRAPAEAAALPGVVEVVADKRELPESAPAAGTGRRAGRHRPLQQPPPGLGQGAGRLPHEVQLLHRSHGPSASGQPAGGRSARRSPPAGGPRDTARSC